LAGTELTARVSGWQAALPQDRREAVVAAAREVADRVADAGRRRAAIAAAARQTNFPRAVHWDPSHVAQGDAGLALVCAHLDRCSVSAGWDGIAHDLLVAAAAAAERRPLRPGLFSGLSGLGFVALQLARDGARYARLADAIDAALIPQASALAESVRRDDRGLAFGRFDAISGLAGIGAYLLARRERPPVTAALERVLAALVALVVDGDRAAPRWRTPAELIGDEGVAARYPHGVLNCGLAHGIPGPLAVMALALSDGVEVPGLRDATAAAAAWLTAHRSDDKWGPNWPSMVALLERSSWPGESGRAAWCYGSPGVARALWLAGTALGDEAVARLAVEAMQAVHRRPVSVRQIDAPTFCHGIAGLLQITLRFAADTGLPAFAQAAEELTDQIMEQYEPASVLGFRNLEPGGNRVDHLGLLDGAPGVALVLLAAATDVEPSWDRLFLLA